MINANPAAIDMLTKFDDSKRAVANLMARENITCQVVDGAPTALFNPKTRVLIVPNWTGLTVEQCDLLMSHEIGHALFTDRNVNLKDLPKGLFTYLNVVEDARIERRMKGAFPGLAPTFYRGYRDFHANGPILQGTKDALIHPKTGAAVPVAGMKLIDRINLHYKIGAFVNVPFTAEERLWLAKIDKSSSTEECLAIARALYAEQKEQDKQKQDEQKNEQKNEQKQQSKQKQSKSDDQDGDDQSQEQSGASNDDENDEANDEANDEKTEQSKASEGKNQDTDEEDSQDQSGDDSDDQDGTDDAEGNGDPSAETNTDAMLEGIASKGEQYPSSNTVLNILYPVFTDDDLKGRVITSQKFTDGAYAAMKHRNAPASDLDTLEAEWNAAFMPTARHMAQEFERRKMARQLQAATTGKSGKLDLTKLASYKFTDDLFKRSIIVPNGKSHGIVMMIDGSGSMLSQFADVLDQTLLFAQFAYLVNIPFEAYMFSDAREYNAITGQVERGLEIPKTGVNALTLDTNCRLIGLVNTTTDRASFKRNVRAILLMKLQYTRHYNRYGQMTDAVKVASETFHAATEVPYSRLGGTPLFNGVLIAERLVARMKQTQRLDKTTFVVITDGEDTNGLHYLPNVPRSLFADLLANVPRSTYRSADILSNPFVVRDAVTKKSLSYVETTTYRGVPTSEAPDNANLTMLLDIMKLRHDTRVVYIFLQERRRGFGRRASRYSRYSGSISELRYMTRAGKTDEAKRLDTTKLAEQMRTDGQVIVPAHVAVADLAIILPVGSVKLTENEFGDLKTDDMTQRKIAAEFTKSMVKAVANRKFVNSVIPHLI